MIKCMLTLSGTLWIKLIKDFDSCDDQDLCKGNVKRDAILYIPVSSCYMKKPYFEQK